MSEAKNGRCELTNVSFHQNETTQGDSYLIAYGTIVSDPKGRFFVGEKIRTSVIKDINVEQGWFQTLNTKYYII